VDIAADIHRIWEDDVVPALSRYTTIPCLSPAFDPEWEAAGHLSEAAALIAAWCRSRPVPDLAVDVVSSPGRTPLLVAEAPAAGADATVLVYGHLDKQPPMGTWHDGYGPYTPVRVGDRLYGRGTADDGYATFAAVAALEALSAAGIARPRVVVTTEASEESGSPDLPGHIDALVARIGRPDLVVCLDSGALTYDRLWLTSSLRGNLVATVRVDVLTEGVHSGSAGGVVPTSFRLLRRLLERLEDPATGDLRLPELTAEVPEGHRPQQDVPWHGETAFPIVPGLVLAGDTDADRLLRRAWSPALTVTAIDGMPAVRDGGNVLRPFTTAKISLRLPPNVDADLAADAVTKALSTDPPDGARVEVEMETPASGWVAPELEPWVSAAFDGASNEAFGRGYGTLGEGGTIPFLAMLGERFPGVPLVATGVLGPGSNAHGPNEFLHLPMAEAVTLATARLVAAAGVRGSG
jgi:acetylornithine deacetylase/succinyl-diaminopimelate desuccinylase-like protein